MSTDPRTQASHLRMRPLPGAATMPSELGRVHDARAGDVLAALALPGRGTVYDLDSGRWPGMPVHPVHPPFQVVRYRTPQGARNRPEPDESLGSNDVNMGINSELVMGTCHTGTHIDALSHITCGADSHWYGGYTEGADLGDFGPLRCDATSIPPIVCRGVLLDVAAARGEPLLPASAGITHAELEAVAARQGVEIRAGDAVLVRTGYMSVWGVDEERRAAHAGAGIDIGAATWLVDRGAAVIGGDTESLEVVPSGDPTNPQPVHIELLVHRGVHIMELVHLEDLSRDQVYEFLFVTLPLRIKGATGSLVRPIAIV